jgi:hypothetical protein
MSVILVWAVQESSFAVQNAHTLRRYFLYPIVVHSRRVQLLTAENSPIVNT